MEPLRGEINYSLGGDYGAIVTNVENWPRHVPIAGFELTEGRIWHREDAEDGLFLVAKPPTKEIEPPEDLWLTFRHELGEKPRAEGIVRFANRFGTLALGVQHFHRKIDNKPEHGERLEDWIEEIDCFRDAFDLWQIVQAESPERARQFLERVRAPWPQPRDKDIVLTKFPTLEFPPSWTTEDPVEYARATVIQTIRHKLNSGRRREYCSQPGCERVGSLPNIDAFNVAAVDLREHRGKVSLTVVAGTLAKTLWLQLSSHVIGQKKLKRCQAFDCRLGNWMDVTKVDRPGAWKMHPACRERLKKQNLRPAQKAARAVNAKKLKEDRTAARDLFEHRGLSPAAISKRLGRSSKDIETWAKKEKWVASPEIASRGKKPSNNQGARKRSHGDL